MIRALLIAISLTGCANGKGDWNPYSNSPSPQCEIPARDEQEQCSCRCEAIEPLKQALKRAKMNRDEWKRYAEKLEHLTGAKPSDETRP